MTLFDPPGKAERDAALQQVDDAAIPSWKDAANVAYRVVARRQETFTNDDIWELLEDEWGIAPPRERRALGPRALAAVKAGVMARTGRYVPSRRPNTHRNPIMVYRSLLR